MPFLIEKNVKGKKYFYLVTAVKRDKKIKQFQFYIGAKKPTKAEIAKYSKILAQRQKDFLSALDPLLSLLSKQEIKEISKAKELYAKHFKQSPSAR